MKHYTSFLDGLAVVDNVIDYEKRARDLRIERESAHARDQLALVVTRLEALLDLPADRPVRVRMENPPAPGWSHGPTPVCA